MLPNVCVHTLLLDNIKVIVDIDYVSIIKYKRNYKRNELTFENKPR